MTIGETDGIKKGAVCKNTKEKKRKKKNREEKRKA